MSSASCDISSSQLMLHPVGKDVTEECEDAWSISKAKESHQVLGAHLLWLVVLMWQAGRAVSSSLLHQLNTSLLLSCSGERAEQCCRGFWALRKAMINMDRLASSWGMHIKKKTEKQKALHSQRFPQFYFLEDFPWFPPKQRRFKYIYIFLYMNIYFPHTQPD